MIFPEKDWAVASPASQGVNPAKMDAALDYLAQTLKCHGGIEEMLVVRNGRMIWQGSYLDLKHGGYLLKASTPVGRAGIQSYSR
jgi:hypothetical protein